jgi:NAD(P)-dependent dehydrogenase (short-subunit alcohol dehydrogenase family)
LPVTPIDLADRRVLVTGAAKGLGLAIARRLGEGGARLLLTDIDPTVIHRAEEPLFEGRATALVKDLAEADSAGFLVTAGGQRLGSLNGLVNCAAWSFHKPAVQITVAEFDRLIAINQRAPFFLIQQFAAALTDADRDPCVVNIASVNALVGHRNLAAYAGTKGALVAMNRALAVELAPRVRVVAISPSTVRTAVTERLISEGEIDPAALVNRLLIKRFIPAEEVSELVAFLFSPAAASITGSNWVHDGGLTAQCGGQ